MRTTVAFLLWGAHAVSAVFPQLPRLRSPIDGLPKDLYNSSLSGRKLQDGTNGTACSICGTYKLMSDYMPSNEPTEDLPNNLTCADWEFTAASLLENDDACVSYQNIFPYCCQGPPTYECEKNIRTSLLLKTTTLRLPPSSPPGLLSWSMSISPFRQSRIWIPRRVLPKF